MRITALYLKNFIGIAKGTGKEEISIKFPKNSNSVIILSGANGSGKSTLMSQLHPFRDSFDDRKKLIIDGKEGIKEIEIDSGKHHYLIKHIYGNKNQSFIKKDGVELNSNGGIRTFNDILQTELGITQDYFKIGKIGSNTTNFIELTASERKTFISKFLPDISDYLEKFEIVKDKFKDLTNQIKIVSSELGQLGNKDELNVEIESLDEALKMTEEALEDNIKKSAISKNIIESTNKDELIKELNELKDIYEEKNKKLQEFGAIGKKFVEKYNGNKTISEIREIISEKVEIVNSLKTKYIELDTSIKAVNTTIADIKNRISKYQLKLSKYNQDDIENVEVKYKEEKEKYEDLVSKIGEYKEDLTDKLSLFPVFEKSFKEYISFLISSYNTLKSDPLNIGESIFNSVENETIDEKLTAEINNIKFLLNNENTELQKELSKLSVLNSNISKYEILKSRPSECIIDSCAFIKDALKYKNLDNDISECEKNITNIKKNVSDFEKRLELLSSYSDIIKQFKYLKKNVNPRNNIFYLQFLNDIGNTPIINLTINEISSKSKDTLEYLNNYAELSTELSIERNKLSEIEHQKKYYENIEEQINSINTELAEANREYEKNESILKSKMAEFSLVSEELKHEEEILSDYNLFLDAKNQYNSFKTQKSDINLKINTETEKLNLFNSSTSDYNSYRNNELSLRQKKTDITNKLNSANTKKYRLIELEEKLKNINDNYEETKVIKDCLDPNKGIPLYFIKAYLEKIKSIANDLLKIAFNDNFEIDFSVSQSEFFIKVNSDNYVKNDIKEASQGELSLATLSISLALIEEAIGEYNILCLDEIDGPLDTNNRQNFINILQKQISKLGIEQVFVISHNNAFDMCSADLILLNGSTVNKDDEIFMKNKVIIYEN